jgi:hypothetical protein
MANEMKLLNVNFRHGGGCWLNDLQDRANLQQHGGIVGLEVRVFPSFCSCCRPKSMESKDTVEMGNAEPEKYSAGVGVSTN